MVDDVCDSWEDMLENGELEKKMESVRVSSASRKATAAEVPSSGGATGFQILKRPNGGATSASTSFAAAAAANYDLNNYVNSEPFVPLSRGPQITVENETRTQFKPSIKILRRTPPAKSEDEAAAARLAAAASQKSYEERAAEYRKARERILGEAGEVLAPDAPPKVPAPPLKSSKPTARPSKTENSKAEVPAARQPQGPDGSRGFRR